MDLPIADRICKLRNSRRLDIKAREDSYIDTVIILKASYIINFLYTAFVKILIKSRTRGPKASIFDALVLIDRIKPVIVDFM